MPSSLFRPTPPPRGGATLAPPRGGATLAVASTLTFLAVAALPLAASAQPAESFKCAPRDLLVDRLGAKFNEEPISVAVTSAGSLLEVLASPEGSWSIIVTMPEGPACLMSAGYGWRGAPKQEPKDPRVSFPGP